MLSLLAFSPAIVAQTTTVWDGSTDTEWEGEGTLASPYLIGTAEELAGLASRTNANETFEGKYFRLTADLWLSDVATPDEDKPLWVPIGMLNMNNSTDEENPGNFTRTDYFFKGNFDGNGHTIYNLWYAHDSEFEDNFDDPFNDGSYDFEGWSKALFGNLDGASVTNLKLSNVNIQCTYHGAALACTAKNSTITDITVDGTIVCGVKEDVGGTAGGIVTEAENSTFRNCSSSAWVRSVSGVGSLAAQLTGCDVSQCQATGRVVAMTFAGGMVGSAQTGTTITDCHSSAEVVQLSARRQGANIGGFAGVVSGATVSNCSSTGKLTVDYNGYGFTGSVVDDGVVESCYAVCDIVKDGHTVVMTSFVGAIGGDHLVGEAPVHGYVRNCYGVATYTYQPTPSDVITLGNHIGGFASSMSQDSEAVNCFYNSTTATGINSIHPAEGDPQPFWFEFGLTTEQMKSQEFVDRLNQMAGVMGISLWKYNPGAYPTPTGVAATPADSPFAGAGTFDNPWKISSKADLLALADLTNHGWSFKDQYILQTADIPLNAPMEQWGEEMPELWTPIGKYFSISNRAFRFHGSYDGGLHTVSNMYMEDNVDNYTGLFGVIGDGAHISNLGVTDAYISNGASGKSIVSGILVGSAGIFNDESEGLRRISNCWTSGYNESFAASGILGAMTQWGKTTIENCYTTAKILSYGYRIGGGFVADDYAGTKNVYLTASYFNGSFEKNGYNDVPGLFNMCNVTDCFYSRDTYPTDVTYEYYNLGRSSEYMTTPEFVNELSYASAASGLATPWHYTAGTTASFFGTAPSVEVTYEFSDTESVTFLAIAGSKISAPAVTAPEEGMVLRGWYDAATSQLFNFSETPVTEPVTLRARWNKSIAPDYTPFKNKFAKTFHIKTPAHLQAFANIVNGKVDYNTDGVQTNSYEGYTIVLDNDIEWNSVNDYDDWGNGATPLPFSTIGRNSNYLFKGVFDGQGHSIIGLYVNESPWSSCFGMFTAIDKIATVKNLILKNAFIEVGATYSAPYAGLLAATQTGTVYRCGAEGKIIITESAREDGRVGGLIASSDGEQETTTLRECYAVTEATLKSQGFGGLIYITSGDIHDSYARSRVKMSGFGWFTGLVTIQQRKTTAHTSWCEGSIDWNWTKDLGEPGGAVYGGYNENNSNLYYDSTVLGLAFGPMDDWTSVRQDPYAFGTPLSTEEMQHMSSLVGLDFETVWGRRNDQNDGYPYLRWTAPGLTNDPDKSGIAEIETSVESPVIEYYRIDGTRVNTPSAPSLYIGRRADGTSTKILIK